MLSRTRGFVVVIGTDKRDCPSPAKLLGFKSTVYSIGGNGNKGMRCFAGSDPFCGRSLHPADAPPMSSEPSRLRLLPRVEFMALNKTDLHRNQSKVGARKQIGRR